MNDERLRILEEKTKKLDEEIEMAKKIKLAEERLKNKEDEMRELKRKNILGLGGIFK